MKTLCAVTRNDVSACTIGVRLAQPLAPRDPPRDAKDFRRQGVVSVRCRPPDSWRRCVRAPRAEGST